MLQHKHNTLIMRSTVSGAVRGGHWQVASALKYCLASRPRLLTIIGSVLAFEIASLLYLQLSIATSFDSADVRNSNNRKRQVHRLIHVVSPFVTKNDTSLFSPLSDEQFSMLVSIKNAQQEFNNTTMTDTTLSGFDSVMVVCAVLLDEYDTLHDILAPYCQRINTLSRHTGTEYSELLPDTKLPFVQDIVDAGTSCAEHKDEDYYLMLTNADICLTSNFYMELSHDLAKRKRKALSVNRKVLSNSNLDTTLSSLNVGQPTPHSAATAIWQQAHVLIDEGKYELHAGYDCFIMHASVVRSLNFGNLFVGWPPWGSNIDLSLRIMAEGYKNIKSKGTSWGTYHLGNNNNWMPSKMFNPDDEMMTDWKKFSSDELAYLAWCPGKGYPPQDKIELQNSINCGKWFRPAANVTSRELPAFVNEGYGTVYLENFAKHLQFTSEGLPIVRRKRNSSPKMQQNWIQKWG